MDCHRCRRNQVTAAQAQVPSPSDGDTYCEFS